MASQFVTASDGRRIHYSTSGDGPITVFFEAGLGKSRTTWAGVAPAVAGFASTVIYDRAGLGRSDPTRGPRACEEMIEDHNVVRAATVSQPCVLVGHSYGGPICRSGAVTMSDNVVGAVLVDEVSETCDELVDGPAMRGSGAYYRGRLALARLGALSGIATRQHRKLLASSQPELDADAIRAAIDDVRREDGSVGAAEAALMEWLGFTDSVRRLRERGPSVPDTALTTISSNRLPEGKRERDFIARSHQTIADLAPNGRHVFAHTRSHHIQLVEPSIVIDEIRTMVRAAGG